MARWTDVADWIGPTPNRRPNGIKAHRGLILHIQEGSEAGTEAWQRNPASQISSHFLAPKAGRPRQMVDTADVAWTEAAGNAEWLSVEIEGHSGDRLTTDQIAGIAAIYARGMREYGWRLQTADSPTGHGLGWHGMGGKAWGSHYDCPGDPIKNQRAAVLGAVQHHLSPATTTEEDDMASSASYKLPTTPGQAATFNIGPSGAGSQLGPCWISVGVDSKNGEARYRVAISGDGKNWDIHDGDQAVRVGGTGAQLWGVQLKPGQRIISVDCLDGTTYKGELYLAVEYGPKG